MSFSFSQRGKETFENIPKKQKTPLITEKAFFISQLFMLISLESVLQII